MLLNWTLAILVSGAIGTLVWTVWSRGILERAAARIVVGQLIGWVVLVALKAWQLDASLTCGLCRRLGDVSWWGIVIATVSSGIVAAGTSRPPVRSNRRARTAWVFSSGITVITYLLLTYFAKETFFHESLWSHRTKWIQLIEGSMMVAWVFVGHFFLIQVTTALSTLSTFLPPAARKFRLYLPLWIYATIPAVLLTVFSLWDGVFTAICQQCAAWRSERPHADKVVLQVLVLWWPLLFLPAWWIPAVSNLWARPAGDKSGQDKSAE